MKTITNEQPPTVHVDEIPDNGLVVAKREGFYVLTRTPQNKWYWVSLRASNLILVVRDYESKAEAIKALNAYNEGDEIQWFFFWFDDPEEFAAWLHQQYETF